MKARVIREDGRHVHATIFVKRVCNGALTFTKAEWEEFKEMCEKVEGVRQISP